MDWKNICIRIAYFLLGALLVCYIGSILIDGNKKETTEEKTKTPRVVLEEPVQTQIAVEENEMKEVTISSNDIAEAPVKWIENYPKVNSDKSLEEKMQERSSFEETMAVNDYDRAIIANSTIDFSNVKITIMGDSITTAANFDGEVQVENSLPVLLQEILNCKEVVNLGIGGSAVSRLGAYPMVERYSEIDKNSDIIIVFGGSNDCLFTTKEQFGEINGDNTRYDVTFCRDLDELCSDIQYEYQERNGENYCKLLYINPPSTVLNQGFYEGDPENRVHQKYIAEAINTIAPKHGFEVIDLYNNNILNSLDDELDGGLVEDGIHMSEEGYRILAEHIASQIIQRIEE